MRASAHRPVKHAHIHAVRSRAAGGLSAARHAPRLAEPQELAMFSDRLDEAVQYENIIRDFVSAHDVVRSADEYDS